MSLQDLSVKQHVMRFPLPANTFPPVRLSTEDKHALLSLVQVVVEDTCKQRHELYEVQKGVVDKRHWKKLKANDNVTVYKQLQGATLIGTDASIVNMRASTLPALMTVGTIQGQLEDLLYGISNNSFEIMRIKTSYIQDGLVDCAVLASLIRPTVEEPFRSVQLKWSVKGRRAFARPFVRFRDSVYVESMGILTSSTGERIGFFLRHSVQVDGVRELDDLGIVRGQISLCTLYKKRDTETVDVFTSSFVDPLGKLNPAYAAKAMAISLCSVSHLAHCAHMKKLTWLLKTQAALCEEKAEECVVCRKPVHSVLQTKKRTCRICQGDVCSNCRESKRLSFISTKTGLVVQRTMVFCKYCITMAAQTSAESIMIYETTSEDHLFDTTDSTDGEEASYSPTVSDGGLISVTDEFDRLSFSTTSSASSFRIETTSSMHYHSSKRNTVPSWML